MIYRKSSESSDTDVLRLHFDKAGNAFVAAGDRAPRQAEDVVKVVRQYKTVRIAGTPNNWGWISQQYALTRERRLEVVGSCVPREHNDKMSLCFVALRNCRLPGTMGGRFFPRSCDLRLYSAGAAACRSRFDGVAEARDWLRESALRTVIRWLPTVEEDAVAALLSLIVDPRLWVSPIEGKEHSTATMEQWLGLTPETWQRCSKGTVDVTDFGGVAAVMDCWYNARLADRSGAPEGFLYRILESADTFEKGIIRASQTFVRLLRQAWMTCLYPNADLDLLLDKVWKTDAERESFRDMWSVFVAECRKESAKPAVDGASPGG